MCHVVAACATLRLEKSVGRLPRPRSEISVIQRLTFAKIYALWSVGKLRFFESIEPAWNVIFIHRAARFFVCKISNTTCKTFKVMYSTGSRSYLFAASAKTKTYFIGYFAWGRYISFIVCCLYRHRNCFSDRRHFLINREHVLKSEGSIKPFVHELKAKYEAAESSTV